MEYPETGIRQGDGGQAAGVSVCDLSAGISEARKLVGQIRAQADVLNGFLYQLQVKYTGASDPEKQEEAAEKLDRINKNIIRLQAALRFAMDSQDDITTIPVSAIGLSASAKALLAGIGCTTLSDVKKLTVDGLSRVTSDDAVFSEIVLAFQRYGALLK